MQPGMYVRIPIIVEEADFKFPRTFALAQIFVVDDLAETATVVMHDLNGCKQYYNDAFRTKEYSLNQLIRCKPPKGSVVLSPDGYGKVMSIFKQEHSPYYLYHISFNQYEIKQFEEKDIKADFTAFDVDPAQMLMQYEFQNPSWFASRYIVSSIMHVLNNAVYGFKVLAGCRVFLLPHQIVTIVRCLETNPVRYMLADEVGLGKTIEACAIIKIMQERNPRLKVLYVIPMPLVEQWKFELMSKFSIEALTLEEAFTTTRHVIISTEELAKLSDNALSRLEFDVITVDETHQILNDKRAYDNIFRLSKAVEHVLLLSATPIQDRKEEFFKLLKLLKPDQYEDMNNERFNQLVDKQQNIQRELYLLLGDMQSYIDFSDSIVDQLKSIANNLEDYQLKLLVDSIDIHAEDMGQEKAYQAASYISEHYRLERSVIRNRRVLLQQQMPQRKLFKCSYPMISSNQLYGEADAVNYLIEWLQTMDNTKQQFFEDIVIPLLAAAFSSPWALEAQFEDITTKGYSVPCNVSDAVQQWIRSADGEIERVDELLDENPDEIKGRLLYCMDYLEQETELKSSSNPCKILVFTQYTQTLKAFMQIAHRRLGIDRCVAFHRGMNSEELQKNAETFQSDPSCHLLVCDELGGEGRNFQMADFVVHLDTPWNANMLEQRIGRLDRLGRDATKSVNSIVIYAQDSIEEQLITLWKDGMSIYTQSLSGLEIITKEVSMNIIKALKEDIHYGLSRALSEIKSETIRMREAVEEEQFYDMTAMLYRPLTIGVERMLSMYQGKEDEIFSQSMISWSGQAGLKPDSYLDLNGKQVTEFSAKNFSPASSMNALLIPPDWSKYNGNKSTARPKVKNQSILGTFNRSYAINREDLHFYAPGDPVFESIISNATTCYRGRACAVEVKDATFNFEGLVFIWNVDPSLKPILDNKLDPILLAQFRTFLPMEQIITHCPSNREAPLVPRDKIAELLSEHYIIRKAEHLGRRTNSKKGSAVIQEFMSVYPPSEWKRWIKEARSTSLTEATQIVKDLWDYNTAVEEARRIVNACKATNHYFGYDANKEENIRMIYQAVLNSLKNFRVTLDAALFMKVSKK